MVSAVVLAASVRREEREATGAWVRRSSSAASGAGESVGPVGSVSSVSFVGSEAGVADASEVAATSAAAGASVPGSLVKTPPVTLTPVTAAASPVRATPVRRARPGARLALCLPGARCVGTYLSDFDTGAHGGVDDRGEYASRTRG